MSLIISDETYEKFSRDFPDIEKWELQCILMRATIFSEYDYWNHFQVFYPLAYKEDRFGNLFAVKRRTYLFHVNVYDMQVYKLPSIIELEPDSEGVVYRMYE